MSWEKIGDAAARVVERLERRVVNLTVHYSDKEERVVNVPITIIEQQPLVLEITVTRESAS